MHLINKDPMARSESWDKLRAKVGNDDSVCINNIATSYKKIALMSLVWTI